MNQYEVMYVLDPALDDSARAEMISRFSDLVVKNGGEVDRIDEWGKRRLAYVIRYKNEGYYVLMYIKGPSELPRELSNMRIADSVLRYLVIRYEGELPAKREMPQRPGPRGRSARRAGGSARRGRGRPGRAGGRRASRFRGRIIAAPEPVWLRHARCIAFSKNRRKAGANFEQGHSHRQPRGGSRIAHDAVGHLPVHARLAVQRRFANQQGVREADYTVICWRQTADFAARYLSKGRRVAVEGSIQNRSYDAQDGSKRYVTEIIADNVEFCDSRPDGARPATTIRRRPPSRRPAMASRRRAGSLRWTTTSFRSDGFAVACGAGLPAPRIQRPCRAGFAAGSAGR